jgi:hypothetical protein
MTDSPIREIGHHLPAPHELLVDSGWHVCDESCPPVAPMPVVPARVRARRRVRRAWTRIKTWPEYRLVHKSRVDDGS